jgi:pyridoxamine 5'-phosphate oxidase
VLATVGQDGRPSARVVLLKGFSPEGFVFYTNLESRKGRELRVHPSAALCFYWPRLHQQVRVEGTTEQVSDAQADAYFATRERGSQIGAWASTQSRPLSTRQELESRVEELTKRYAGKPIPRPPFWSGFRLIPDRIEFWNGRPNRLHDRVVYQRRAGTWSTGLLFP